MKSLKKLALSGLIAPLLFSLLSFKNLAIDGGEVLVVKIYEGLISDPRITISTKDKTVTVNLEAGRGKASLDKSAEIIASTMEQYVKEGFKVEVSSSMDLGTNKITTYILTK
jgi:hypothetical protein